MGSSSEKKHKSSHRDKGKDGDGSSKRHKSSHSHRSSSKKHDRAEAEGNDGDFEWVEKVAYVPAIKPPTRAPVDSYGTFNPGERTLEGGVGLSSGNVGSLTDGFGEGEDGSSAAGSFGGGITGGDDLFSSMGVERKRREVKEKVDPTVSLEFHTIPHLNQS